MIESHPVSHIRKHIGTLVKVIVPWGITTHADSTKLHVAHRFTLKENDIALLCDVRRIYKQAEIILLVEDKLTLYRIPNHDWFNKIFECAPFSD